MNKARKLARYYNIETVDAELLIAAGLDTPRKIKADKGKVDAVGLKKAEKDKVKAR